MNSEAKSKPVILFVGSSMPELVERSLYQALDCELVPVSTQQQIEAALEKNTKAGHRVSLVLAERTAEPGAEGFPAQALHKAKNWAGKHGQEVQTALYQFRDKPMPASTPLGVDRIISVDKEEDLGASVKQFLEKGRSAA